MTEQTGSAPAGNPAPAAGTETPPAATPPAAWFDGFKDTALKGWVQNKNFESAETLANSYFNLEKLFGHDKAGRTVVMPGKDATPDDVNAFYSKLGRPPKADEYTLPKEGVNEKIVAAARETFFKEGLTAKQAQAVADWWLGVEKGMAEGKAQELQTRQTQELDQLRKEWGAAFDDKSKLVDRAIQQFGLDADSLSQLRDAWGPYKAMQFFSAIGEGMGEGSFVRGEGAGKSFSGAMTPDQARSKIADLRGDAGFVRRYTSGDVDARAEMEQLHKWAYGE